MAAGDTGVREPEMGVLAAADDIAAFAELVGAAAAVVERQRGGESGAGRRCVPALGAVGGLLGARRVPLRTLLGITLLVVPLVIARLRVALLVITLVVAGLCVALLVVTALLGV